MLITGGRLGDILGRKRMFLVGMAAFAVASTACGMATTGATLVGARLVQGVAAALMVPQVLATMHVTLAPERRAGAFVLYGAIAGTANVSGPLLGGLLVQADLLGLGWRPVFLVNVPVAIVALVVAGRLLPESRVEGQDDWTSSASCSPRSVCSRCSCPSCRDAISVGRPGDSVCSPRPCRWRARSCGGSGASSAGTRPRSYRRRSSRSVRSP